MGRNFELIDEEVEDFGEDDENGLTPEGQQLWNNIARQELPRPKAKVPVLTYSCEAELESIKIQIKKMIQHSLNVINDCDEIINEYKTEKEYLAGDAKIAKTLHGNLIGRLKRLLNGKEVFDFPVKIPDTLPPPEKSVLYYKPRR